MILVDTSVWIEYLSRGHRRLAGLIEGGEVLGHPFIEGELACGGMRNRSEILELLWQLPRVPLVLHEEALALIEQERLYGLGLGWIDLHLLASARLVGCGFWSLDKQLNRSAEALGIKVA